MNCKTIQLCKVGRNPFHSGHHPTKQNEKEVGFSILFTQKTQALF